MDSTAPQNLSFEKATSKEWWGLAVIALPCMLYSMDLTILNLAVPAIAADLKPSASQLLWIIDIYGFMVAGFLLVMGALGDTYGRRKMLLIGAAVFGVMSIIAAFSQTANQLIAARAALGIAGATLAPSTLSLITNMFRDENERTFAISMWIASFSAGAILGPLAGGVIIQYFSWAAAFLVAVPVMMLLLALGPFLLPEFRSETPPKMDFISSALSLSAVLSLIYGIKSIAEHGTSMIAVLAIVAAILLVSIFIMRQRTSAAPMIDLALFRIPTFTISLLINLLAIMFMFGSFIFMAQYLQLVAGLSVLEAGLWSLPGAIAFTIMSFLNAKFMAKFSGLTLFVAGLLMCAVGFMGLAFSSSLMSVVLWMIVASVGFTPVIALTTGYIVGAVPLEKAGVASALSETAAELGGALGIALLGSFATYIYRARMADVEGVAGIKTSLAATVDAVKDLPSAQAAAILETARAAFMSSYHATAIMAAIVLAGLAAVAQWQLKGAAAASH